MERYIGKMLDNRYEILEVIGTGGMAVVFKAKCHRLNRMVAIKMLKRDLSEDAQFRRRFHEESKAVAMLSHPNIVAIYDVSRGGGMDYIVMELIDGITLKQYMERRGRLKYAETLHFITQIMRGLSHAHSRGIVHRDIKPQNIMVLRDGTVKVTDFGIACRSNAGGETNEAIGSVHYTSPEQAKGEAVDNRSDIYSAGVVLYEMLTGQLPFKGNSPISVAIQHFSARPLAPREIDQSIPVALEQICMKAMSVDKERRYKTADDMIEDLEAFHKDPQTVFDYTSEDFRREGEPESINRRTVDTAEANRRRKERAVKPEEMDREERPHSSWWKILLLIVVLLGAGYWGVTKLYAAIMDSFTPPPQTEFTVPDLRGYTVEEAEKLPEIAGIFTIVEESYEYDAEMEEGKILSQDPEANRVKKSGDGSLIPINVTLSLGVRSGAMPNMVGMEGRTARLTLQQREDLAPLKLDVVEGEREYSTRVEKGYVLRTVPAAGEPLSEGDTVVLILSDGPEIFYATMVSCFDLTVEEAKRMMDEMGLLAEFQAVESDKPEGTVTGQSVAPGDKVQEGTTVVFTYSEGPKQVERKVSYTIPLSLEDVYVEIYLDSTQVCATSLPGNIGTFEQSLFADKGTTHRVRFYLNHSLVQDEDITFGD